MGNNPFATYDFAESHLHCLDGMLRRRHHVALARQSKVFQGVLQLIARCCHRHAEVVDACERSEAALSLAIDLPDPTLAGEHLEACIEFLRIAIVRARDAYRREQLH